MGAAVCHGEYFVIEQEEPVGCLSVQTWVQQAFRKNNYIKL